VSRAALLLVRHAESSWNAAGRWQGHADPPLSERGVAQANALARDLAGEPIDRIVSSDLRRAAETAAILGRARGLEPLLEPRLRELDLGAWEGLTRDEIASTAQADLRRFDAGDPDVRPGGGETLREIERRVRFAVRELVEAHAGQRLAVVTHLGVIRALVRDVSPISRGTKMEALAAGGGEEFGNACWRRLDPTQLLARVAPTRRSGSGV